jgi:NADP-dependent 3-hydroxy acid dehydrogenase YdfG
MNCSWSHHTCSSHDLFLLQAKDAFDGSGKVKILEPEDIANAVIYATTQPPYAAVNEILIEPREAPI